MPQNTFQGGIVNSGGPGSPHSVRGICPTGRDPPCSVSGSSTGLSEALVDVEDGAKSRDTYARDEQQV